MKVNFSISPRILSHLGEDLIKNESIALFELIKNSYDANATSCEINFDFSNEDLKSLSITDNGDGMNINIIKNIWLVVGTDYKRKELDKFKKTQDQRKKRLPLGEKGIGRLSVHKLGNKITLISKSKNNNEVKLSIDWNQLNSAQKIDDFIIELTENEMPEEFINSTGTKIIVEELKTNWDRRQLREVYRNITSLNSPFSDKSDTFNIHIKSNSNVFDGLPNFEEIKNSALYFGHCKISSSRIIDFQYEFKPWDSLSKIEKRSVSIQDLSTEDKNIQRKDNSPINLDTSGIGDIEFDIIIFDTDAQIFNYTNIEKTTVKDYLRENGGIRVYRDGVRIYNYGEKDNDWLGIDLKRVQRIGGNVSNNIIIGAVKINRNSSYGLIEKTNREGFIENESYFDFLESVDYALSLFVRQRNIDKHRLSTLYKKYRSVEPVLADLNELISVVEKKIKDKTSKDEILKYLYRINTQYHQVKEILIKSANAGLNLGSVIHTLDKLLSQLTGCINRNEKQKAIEISLLLEIVRGYSSMLKKSDIRQHSLSEITSIALDNYEFRFLDHSINVISNYKESTLNAYLAKAEAISVLTNLLDNSIYWVSYSKNNKENRKISVFLTDQIKGYNSIIVSDNGPGFNLPLDVATEPFQTGKPHNIGSGLGLHVAKEMMLAMKGKLLLIADKNEINFPTQIQEDKVNNAIVALCFPIKK
ncbi:ATP-binding protein [Haemophilus parainfluenzae]|uniref:ATP-binding protein n=1 Tax=Haemophilus parainfluenzae TaxID=729 RepID=UPI0018A53C48|nr:ATP-binding protein [Haemophilus parainfluenzae]QOR22587.1 ATP-binding protein [Haemophilus parainfluenzae]